MSFKFGKTEHLKSRKSINLLITEGNSFVIFPIKTRWLLVPDNKDVVIKCAFSVPKRKFKKAVERNYIKRIMCEAYRLNKQPLITLLKSKEQKLQLLLTFIGNEMPNYKEIESKIILTLHHLININEKNINSNTCSVS